MNMSYKICFVCTGNACRSPFAECVTKKLLAMWKPLITRLQRYIAVWPDTLKVVVNDW